MQHALGVSKSSLRSDRTAQSVQSRYRFEAGAMEEVVEFVEVSVGNTDTLTSMLIVE